MNCTRCKSENVTVEMLNVSSKTKTNHTGLLHGIIRLTLIICTCGIWLLIPKRKENGTTRMKYQKKAICHNCGNVWNI